MSVPSIQADPASPGSPFPAGPAAAPDWRDLWRGRLPMPSGEPAADGRSSDTGAAGPPDAGWSGRLRALPILLPTLLISLCVGLHAFNAFLAAAALPSAVQALGGAQLLPFASALYLLASVLSGVSAPRLAQGLGLRQAFLLSGLIFLAGTLQAAGASSMAAVLVGRIGQGVGEGALASLAIMLLARLYPPRLIPAMLALEALVWAIAAFAGPVLAGAVTSALSWRASFLLNLPPLGLLLVLALRVAPAGRRPQPGGRLPLVRFALLSTGFLMLLAAGLNPRGISVFAMLVQALASLALFVLADRQAPQRLLPRGAFTLGSAVRIGLWTLLLMPMAQAGSGVYLQFSLQRIWGLSPFLASLLAALTALSWSGVAMVAARRGSDPGRALLAGIALEAAGLLLLALALKTALLGLLLLSLAVIGAGFGLAWAPLCTRLLAESPGDDRDRTAAMLGTLQSTGYGLGGALAGLIVNGQGLAATSPGPLVGTALSHSFLIASLLTLPALLAARRMLRLGRERGASDRAADPGA